MVFKSRAVKGALRAIVAAAVLTGATLWVGPSALAASDRPYQTFRSDNGNGGAFNLDQDPCRLGNGRRRGRSGANACPGFGEGGAPHNGQARQPGSRAFGLQFNSGDY